VPISKTLASASLAATAIAGSAVALPVEAQAITPRITRRLDRPPLDRHLWGIAVLDDGGRLVVGRNADRLFTPASNTKLVVTAAATMLLTPDWTARTSLYGTGPVRDGVLLGDLILYGRGDPTWSRRCYSVDTLAVGVCSLDAYWALRALAGQLIRRGIRRVAGAVVGDGSYFEREIVHPTWEVANLVWGYAAPVSGLGFNENTITATVAPGLAAGDPAAVTVEPDFADFGIEVRATTNGAGDRNDRLVWSRAEDGHLQLDGSIRVGAEPTRATLAVSDPARFAAAALARVLADSAITVGGGVAGTTDSLVTKAARAGDELAAVDSRPLAD